MTQFYSQLAALSDRFWQLYARIRSVIGVAHPLELLVRDVAALDCQTEEPIGPGQRTAR